MPGSCISTPTPSARTGPGPGSDGGGLLPGPPLPGGGRGCSGGAGCSRCAAICGLDELRRGKRLAPEPPDLSGCRWRGTSWRSSSAQETRRTVYQAVQALSPADREVITLYYYGELSLKEVGAAMGISPRGGPHPAVPGAEETEDQIGGTAMTFGAAGEIRAGSQRGRAGPGGGGAGEERGHRRLPGGAGGGRAGGRRRPRPPAGEVRHIQKKMNRRCGGRRRGRPASCWLCCWGCALWPAPWWRRCTISPTRRGFGTSIEGEPDTECEAIALESHRPVQA